MKRSVQVVKRKIEYSSGYQVRQQGGIAAWIECYISARMISSGPVLGSSNPKSEHPDAVDFRELRIKLSRAEVW